MSVLEAEVPGKRELEAQLAAAKRVAEEAMRLLLEVAPELVGELRNRLDALEAGDSEHGEHGRGGNASPGG